VTRSLAISFGALGDFLLTLPLLRELARGGGVALLTRAAYRALLPDWLESHPFLPVDGSPGTRLFTPGAVFPTALAELVDGADIHVFAREDELLRRNLERHGAARLLFHDPRPESPPHIVARYFAAADLQPPPNGLEQPPQPPPEPRDTLWIHAGSGSPAKSLPIPFLAEHACGWRSQTGQPVLVSFGEADLDRREPLRQAFARQGIPYTEVLCPTLAELRASIARRARRYLGADTGVTHLAAALGKETIVGYRATDPAIWRPTGNCRVLVVGPS
jgi:heptosyltransferase-2